MNLESFLTQDAFISVNKTAIKFFKADRPALLMGELIFQRKRARLAKEINHDKSFHVQSYILEETLGIGEDARRSALNKLVQAGWVSVKKRGIPAKFYYIIFDEIVMNDLNRTYELETSDHDILDSSDGETTTTEVGLFQSQAPTKTVSHYKNSKKGLKPLKSKALTLQVSDYFIYLNKKFHKVEMNWGIHASKYGKNMKQIIDSLSGDDSAKWEIIKAKIDSLSNMIMRRARVHGFGLNPSTLIASWDMIPTEKKSEGRIFAIGWCNADERKQYNDMVTNGFSGDEILKGFAIARNKRGENWKV